ncbi:cinnamoyl-CoA reductase 2-like isoform X2 [Vitis riparia]|uniref:cinnamoyl-CoA reductase 2-like isoform X2 n=1 Tax=Vitis riparia TaxID=96939 RepID=UPI00155AF9B8|nr:cinnamoyl-CoA reductase 2-like isoform X2 [Vitis riparia]
MAEKRDEERVCVTGAGGYVASWLVKLLLSKGFIVHGTVRDPCDEKNSHMKKLEKASENLKLFKADLLELESLCAAIDGCTGVFHVASPVPSAKVANPEVELLEPAVTGTRNVLKACEKAKVKKVVVVSSAAAVNRNPNWPMDRPKDEECWSDPEFCRTNQDFYSLAKTLAESEALEHAKKSDLNIVTICPSLVIGPMLQSTLNASSLLLLKYLKDANESVENKDRPIIDVRDLADAIFLIYDKPEAEGRYICSSYTILVQKLIEKLKNIYPNYNYSKSDSYTEVEEGFKLSSKKLESLGWKYRPLEETLMDAVKDFEENGLLDKH